MLEKLKKEVYEANMLLWESGLVIFTWGNVSGIDEEKKLVVIKPSGVNYQEMTMNDMVVIDLDGNKIEGNYNPSSDTPTHLEIYKKYPNIKGIVHTHSKWATIFAQAGKEIKTYGTTHADYNYGNFMCTRDLKEEEIIDNYEKNTGKVIIERLEKTNIENIVGILVKSHGPFAWGENSKKAVENAIVLEEIAMMAYHTEILDRRISNIQLNLQNKHFFRKHGKNAYYGQNKK